MLLFAALSLLAVASSQVNPLNDGDEGVCHEFTTVTYTDHESREVTETRSEWCWKVFKGFRCEVPYTHWEVVPVTKQRQVDTLVCCEGYELHQGICMRLIPLETNPLPMPETTPIPVSDSDESSSSEENVELGPTPTEASSETTPQETTPVPVDTTRGFLSMDDIEVAPDSEEDVEAATESIETTPAPVDTTEEKGLPTMEDVELAPEPSEESSTSFYRTLAPIVVLQVDQERNNNNNNNNKAEENAIIKFLASQTTPPAPAATKEAALAAEATPDAAELHNSAKAEVMAAEAIGIFAKEIIKSLGDPTVPPEEESAIPGDLPSTDEEPTTELEPLNPQLTAVEKALLQTMTELSETLLRSMSRLHQAWASLRRTSAPKRASFQ